jgi:hypothetical protein
MGHKKTFLKLIAFILVASPMFASRASADPVVPPIPQMDTKDAFGEELWYRLKEYYYQTLFDKLGDINSSLYSNSLFNIHLQEGRLLLIQDGHTMLADHFGLNASAYVPTGSLLSFGGDLGAYLLRIRQLPSTQYATTGSTLKDDLKDWDPSGKLSDNSGFQQNISPWIDSISDEVKAGNFTDAKQIFGDNNIPQKQYLDLLAGLKLPFEMPWTAARILNDKKFLIGDLASFVAQGGIFARLGGQGVGWNTIAGPWAGIFLDGQFRFGIFKMAADKCLLRIDSEKDKGYNFNAFDDDFRIPIAHGLIFGHNVNAQTTMRPFTAAGMSYNSKLFARTYQLDFSMAGVSSAYDAAVHGNLTVLDDMAKAGGQGVEVLSERYTNGHYNQTQFQIAFGPIQINDTYNSGNTEEDFWDKRGTFKYFTANSIRTSYADVNLLVFNVRQTRTNNLMAEAYPVAPGGPFPPRLDWSFDEVNVKATVKDQREIQRFIEALKPDSNGQKLEMSKYTKFHAAFQIQVHPEGVQDFQNHTADDVWRAAGQILFNDETIWQNETARAKWLADNQNGDTADYDQVNHWATAFTHPPAASDLKNWFADLINWQRTSYWDALGVRLFLALMAPEHRYMKLQLTPDGASGSYFYQDGTYDLNAYPDDWEYLTIPDIQPQVPPPPQS